MALRYDAQPLLDFHDFFFFGPYCGVQLGDVGVGELLDFVEGPAFVVLADQFVLQQFLDRLISVGRMLLNVGRPKSER